MTKQNNILLTSGTVSLPYISDQTKPILGPRHLQKRRNYGAQQRAATPKGSRHAISGGTAPGAVAAHTALADACAAGKLCGVGGTEHDCPAGHTGAGATGATLQLGIDRVPPKPAHGFGNRRPNRNEPNG